jgi:hypothetical protein
MDLISSIIDNATVEEKAASSGIQPSVIDGGFHQPEKNDNPPLKTFEDGNTAEIFSGQPAPSSENETTILESGEEDQSGDFDVLTDIEKKRNLLYAQMYVILIDTGAGLVLQLASGNWTEEAEKKYTISKIKRLELAEAWAEVMNLEGHKKDPKTALWMMFGSFYLPLIIVAVKDRVKLQRDKKEKEAKKVAAKKLEVVKKAEFQNTEDKGADLIQVANQLEIVPSETPEEEHKRITAQIDHANAISIEANPEAYPTKDATATLRVKPTPSAAGYLPAREVTEAPQIEAKAVPAVKETRGRQKGSRKNPKTGKFEMPTRSEGGYYFYPWGEKVKIPAVRNRKKK